MGKAKTLDEIIEMLVPTAKKMSIKLNSKEAGVGYATAFGIRDNPQLMTSSEELFLLIYKAS